MAAFKRLLAHGHPPPPRHLASLLRRSFCSDPNPTPPPPPEPTSRPNSNFRNPVPLQPVSYPAKPKAPPQEEIRQEYPPERQFRQSDGAQQGSEVPNAERRAWSRDEMRYMKDGPAISPVSYAARVAPLPEDRANAAAEEGERIEEMDAERRRIEEYRRRGGLRQRMEAREEEVKLPYPQLIKVDSADKKSEEKSKTVYDVKEAIRLVKANAKKTFEETLEAHVRMTRDLVRTDLKLDGSVRLPHGAGKSYRVAVFAEGAHADEAREAGAEVVGGPELVDNIVAGKAKIDFDKVIATPAMIKHLKKIAKYLKKLMPDTKKGTLTNDISRAVREAKERVPFEKDKTAIVHVPLGKVKFPENSLKENIGAFVHALLLAKPAGLKKSSKFAGYVDAFHITSTMGRSYPVSIQSLSMAADQFSKTQVK